MGDDLTLPAGVHALIGKPAADAIARAVAAESFKGKASTGLSILSPAGLQCARLVIVGVGGASERSDTDFVGLGGAVLGLGAGKSKSVTMLFHEGRPACATTPKRRPTSPRG